MKFNLEILPVISEKLIDNNPNSKILENLNNELNLENKRKKLIEKIKEIKNENSKILLILTEIEKQLEDLAIQIDFESEINKIMENDDKMKKFFDFSVNIKTKKLVNCTNEEAFLRNRQLYNVIIG